MQNLYDLASSCFLSSDLDEKIEKTFEAVSLWQTGKVEWKEGKLDTIYDEPGRPELPELFLPKDLPKRKNKGLKSKAAAIHSMAHIELTAINLAWDSIYRYRDMPKDYYEDWAQCAKEEAGHFVLLRQQLRELGYDYGSFPAHNELWKMAVTTGHDIMDRMAVVHRAFEARALDVVPGAIKRFDQSGDTAMVSALNLIANDEVGHVSSGTRWYRYRCEQKGLDPDVTFQMLMEKYLDNPMKGPFNIEARQAAGFSEQELSYIKDADENFRKNR